MFQQHLGRNSGPIHCHQWYFLSATMGSCKNTGSISEKTAGPFRTTGRIFGSNDGPILGFQQHLGRIGGPLHDHWQVLSAATMGPYECFGSILGRIVGPFIAVGGIFASNNGLMHGYREISERTVGPFRIISRIFGNNNGPIPEYRQHLSEELLDLFVTISSSFGSKMGLCKCFGSISGRTVGPFIAIGGIFGSNNRLMQGYREHLSESSRTISRIFGRNDGPILGYRQHLLGEVVGLFVSISRFIRQQRWAHMSASAASLDEQQAHALPSVVFFVSNNGPIQVYWEHLGTNSRTIQNHQ